MTYILYAKVSVQGMIKVDQGTKTMLYGYLLYDERVIVMDVCES